MTQVNTIIAYLEEHGSITPMQAFAELGITKLATRVGEAKKDGYKIVGKRTQSKNRYGKTVNFMTYTMGE